jgi:hypothetical protein
MEARMTTRCEKCGWEAEGRYCTRCGYLKKFPADEGTIAVPPVQPENKPSDCFIGTQGDQKPDKLDTARGNGHHEARWEYKHVFLTAAKTLVEHDDASEKGTKTQVRPYKPEKIEKELQTLGGGGWEVVSMEPHWFWERLNGNTSPETVRPKAITGWYCTFKRRTDLAEVAPEEGS